MTPEQEARARIDEKLEQSGWKVQDRLRMNLKAGPGVAVREAAAADGHCDYRLFVDGRAVGVVEAKAPGQPLMVAESQTLAYAIGTPVHLNAPIRPLPFLYESNGGVLQLTNRLDPNPRSRVVFSFPRPETLRGWLETALAVRERRPGAPSAETFLGRLQHLPPLDPAGLWGPQVAAIQGLEASLQKGRRRALIHMATGAGKTFTTITALYRLIRYGGAGRVLFLVDRGNLGRQALEELEDYRPPGEDRAFPQLYNVRLLSSNRVDPMDRVVITTLQRAWSILGGEPELDPAAEERSVWDGGAPTLKPAPVVYNPALPPEHFDLIVVDECHRSIYTLWRQVLEYFDATILGLTATPGKDTYAFFQKNVVSEYTHEQAVRDRVNVPFEVYEIRTRITSQGAQLVADGQTAVGRRDRQTREVRWERLDEDLKYTGSDLDRDVVSEDQIRTVVRELKEKLFTEIFPGRKEIPKTLFFAKNDDHAEDILRVVRDELDLSNEAAVKITYRPESDGEAEAAPRKTAPSRQSESLIQRFRMDYYPRIAVTVDMISTGTDIKPLECLVFMRAVKSRALYDQMKGRGVRVIDDVELRSVTPDAERKTHFVIVDAVGVCREEKQEARVNERKKLPDLRRNLAMVAEGGRDGFLLGRLRLQLDRLDRELTSVQQRAVLAVSNGVTVRDLVVALTNALDPDQEDAAARRMFGLADDAVPDQAQVRAAQEALRDEAVDPLVTNPELRELLGKLRTGEQVIDGTNIDVVEKSGFSEDARARAEATVRSFEDFLAEHKDEIAALQVLYARPYQARLSRADIKALAEAIELPPRQWTPERLWAAYEQIERDRVRGASAQRTWTDLVSLVRFALHQEEELRPFPEGVRARFDNWMAQQANRGRQFNQEQVAWLTMIRDQIAVDAEIRLDDLKDVPFSKEGGKAKARKLFGEELGALLEELNRVLVA